MATIDYKEKYEQALEKARQLCAYPTTKPFISDLQDLFPELAESEDEKTKRILHSISSKMSIHLRDIFTEEEFQCFDTWSNAWLKRQGEQKPAWSEEDENRLSDAVFFVREYQIPTRDKRLLNAAKEAEEWLKSLKERYTCKPSELQLECLDDAIKHYQSNGSCPVILMELLEELKKL